MEVLLSTLHETKPQASALPTLSLRVLRDAVLAGDPGCVCDPELFTGPAGLEPRMSRAQDREARIDRGAGGVRVLPGAAGVPGLHAADPPGRRGVGRVHPR